MSTVEVTNLSKPYGDIVALDDVLLTIPGDEFTAVPGQSGAGKSTLLRCLNGVTRSTSGSITTSDANVMGLRSNVAVIFQRHYILGQVSTYNSAFTGTLGQTSSLGSLPDLYDGDDKQEAFRALEAVGLLGGANRRVGKMSGGQQWRVGIVRALVQSLNLLLVDKPVASLDPVSTEVVVQYIRDAVDERDLITIANPHRVNIAREFSEQLIGTKDGQVVFDDYREDFDVDVIDRIHDDIETKAIRGEQANEPPENNATATGGVRLREY